jgi:signal transduction histidine kinase
LAVPLLRAGRVVGVFSAARFAVAPFTERQIALAVAFADQALIAIENARLFQELDARTRELARSVDELTALGEVTQAVSSTLDVETVLARIVDHARRLSGSDGGAVFEYDEASGAFHLRASHGVDEALVAMLRERPLRMGEGVTGRAAAARAPEQVPDVLEEGAYQEWMRETIVSSGYRSLLAVPLLGEARVLGGLVVNRRIPGTFPPEVVALMQTFASQSALAIQNARLFKELETKGRELEAASRHKSQFLANMSHELRTPLNAIIGYTELIADGIYGQVPEKIAEVLGRVQASGHHLLELINAVLDLAKIEAGQLSLTLQPYSPREVVHSVVNAAESLAAAKGLALRVEAPADLPAGRGDERRLSQVLLNLVGNAIKFTDSGEVCVRASAAGGDLLVSVSDTGPGIEPAQQARVFEEFQQADGSSTRGKGGTGLGLAIARRIVELHGGRIWVESAPGQGATFSFALPLRVESQAVLA